MRTIENGLVRLEAATDSGRLSLVVSARREDGCYLPILERIGTNVGEDVVRAERPDTPTIEVERFSAGGAMLTIRGEAAGAGYALVLRLREGSAWVEVSEVLSTPDARSSMAVGWVEAVWRFVDWQAPGEVFSPVLVPEPGDVVGRHVMRAPALTAQTEERAAALVYDTDSVAKTQSLPACMNLLREEDGTPVFRVGLRPHHVRGHVYYSTSLDPSADAPGELHPARPLHYAYHLFVSAQAEPGAALNAASRRLWGGFGSRHFKAAPRMPVTYEDLARQIYPRALDLLWAETVLEGRRVGAMRINRSYTGDVWFCQWFNQLRSAYGLYAWGQQTGNEDWTDRAVATRDLVLAAPQDRGLFPTVFVFGEPPRWVHSHHQGGGPGIYHLFDMSWTVTQLLRWHRDLVPDARSLDFARAYCKGVVDLQESDGSLPAYVDARNFTPVRRVDAARLVDEIRSRDPGDRYVTYGLERLWSEDRFVHSAEDAGTLLALTEMARLLPPEDPDRETFVRAAGRIADWLEDWVYAEGRWIDFEVYYSCSPKPLDFYDARSGQWPQNTLCMHAATAGLLSLYEVTGATRYLDLARRAMNRLTLYQQVWDPPFLNFYGFGGYGVMNTDGEWSDARQAQFADTHLDWYRALGEEEHLERALAACRASFTTLFLPALSRLYPTGWYRQPEGLGAENHAHGGRDALCGVSGFDWGSGSALATAAYFRLQHVL